MSYIDNLKDDIDQVLAVINAIEQTDNLTAAVDLLNGCGVPTMSGLGCWNYPRLAKFVQRYSRDMTADDVERLEDAWAALA